MALKVEEGKLVNSNKLDRKISNFMYRKELEFPGLSLLGNVMHHDIEKHRSER